MRKLISPMLHDKRTRAGRLGGLAKLKRYGRKVFVEMGLSGGRPKIDLFELLRQTAALEAENKIEGGRPPNNLRKLRRLYLGHKSNGDKNKDGEPFCPEQYGSPIGEEDVTYNS